MSDEAPRRTRRRRAVPTAPEDGRHRSSEAAVRAELGTLFSAATPDLTAPARTLLTAGVQAFAQHGYSATTTRDIASRAGMSPAALYVHYRSKEILAFTAIRLGHEQVLHAVADAVHRAGDDPGDRVGAFVRAFSFWHAQHHTLARVAQDELDALTAEHFAEVAQLRRGIEGLLRGLVEQGAADGAFFPLDVPATTVAVLSLGVDVARWYPHSTRTPEEVGDLYAELAVRMLHPRPQQPPALHLPEGRQP